MYRVFEALDELGAIVEEARGVPMTAGCVVPRGDVLELIDDIKDAIPGELDDAQDVLDARDQLLNEAKLKPIGKAINWQRVEQLKPFGGIRIEDNVVARPGVSENLTRRAFDA